MADDAPRIAKKGGYSGSLPASAVGPPPKTPSGSVQPSASRKATSRKKSA